MKKNSYDIREVDAWGNKIDGFEYNASYYLGTLETSAQDERKAFTRWLKNKRGITFKKNRIRIEYDGAVYEITDRKTGEPLFAMIPNY